MILLLTVETMMVLWGTDEISVRLVLEPIVRSRD